MTGFMTKVVGADAIYDGSYKAGEALQNGQFVTVAADGTVKKTTGAGDIVMKVRSKESLWGMNAVRLDVQAQGAGTIYFVEKVNPGAMPEWDDTNLTTEIGEFVRMHQPLTGEQALITVDDTLYAALAEGDLVTPAANGLIAKQ